MERNYSSSPIVMANKQRFAFLKVHRVMRRRLLVNVVIITYLFYFLVTSWRSKSSTRYKNSVRTSHIYTTILIIQIIYCKKVSQ